MSDPKKTYLALAALLIWASSCGKAGDGDTDHGGGVYTPVVPPPALALTEVGMDTMAYRLPDTPSCLKQQSAPHLPKTPQGAVTDGDLAEWGEVGGIVTDTIGDAQTGFDLTTLQAAVDGASMHLAMAGTLAPSSSLHIEFGGALVRDDELITNVSRLYRLDHGVLQELQNGIWEDLGDDGDAAAGTYGTEMRISRRSLGDVVTWPLWWVRFYSVDADDNVKDTTLAAHYRSLLEADHPPFDLSGCSQWSGRGVPFSFAHIRDADFTRQANAPKAGPLAEKAFQLVRMAFNMVSELLPVGDELPINRLTIISTLDEIKTPQTIGGYGGDLAMVDRYRAMRVSLTPLVDGSGRDFPEGDVLRQAERHLWLLYLDHQFTTAPSYLKAAVATALTDLSFKTHIGLAYYFDRFADGITPFVHQSDVKAPATLAARAAKLADPSAFDTAKARQAYAQASNAKTEAFGRLLGIELEPRLLLTAWKHAAVLAAGGRDPVTAFTLAVEKGHGDRAERAKIAKLWSGWLHAGAYTPDYAPDALTDSDADGVVNRIEKRGGTSLTLSDSDDNGWNDNTAYVLGDLKTPRKDVSLIVPDGNFGDWLELMPKRVISDLGRSGICPRDADINYYAAITSRDELIVGAVANDFWRNDPNARWEVVVDMPLTGEQMLISANSKDQSYVFKNGKTGKQLLVVRTGRPVGGKSIEWVIRRQDLGIDTHFNTLNAVHLRVRTTYKREGKVLFCDETGVFTPNVTQ